MRKTLGIIGGMGPAATVDMMSRIVAMSEIDSEQDGVRVLIDNNPRVPDRNKAIAGTGPSPAPILAQMARGLQNSGADFLVMACNTAHAFEQAITSSISVPFVSMIDETVSSIVAKTSPPTRVGLLAAAGCLDAGLYQRALVRAGIDAITLEGTSRESFMRLLYAIKSGDTSPAVRQQMILLARELTERGGTLVLAGCTEVPLVLNQKDLDVPLVDSTEVLAHAAVEIASGRRKLDGL